MSIKLSVGSKGRNKKVDVKVIQAALNLSKSAKFKLTKKLTIDGKNGGKTIAAIELFQKSIVGLSKPDGRVDPKGKTIRELKKQLKKGITEDAMLAIMASGSKTKIKKYMPSFKKSMTKYKINTALRQAHFLAQVGHESHSFYYTEEIASGAAYENRKDLGNTQKGDGKRFKGRGFLQLTGRTNYSKYGKYVGVDFLKKGKEKLIATTIKYAVDSSCWYWTVFKKLNKYADKDNLKAVTRRVNGGYNGLADRRDYLNRAKFFLVK